MPTTKKPRVFLGSSGQQAKLLSALELGLEDVADVVPWTTSFNPGTTTLERLIELTHEVDYAVFVFAQDDWTSKTTTGNDDITGQASPRDNVVFEAGLFGGVLGMRRTFILHANGSKLPTDLLGLTCVRYRSTSPAEVRTINESLRKAIESEEARSVGIEGDWWQFSLTERTNDEPSAVSLLRIVRDSRGTLEMSGTAWEEDGRLSCRYRTEALKETPDSSGIFYYWKGVRPLDPSGSDLYGTGELNIESADRGAGYFITRCDSDPPLNFRTTGVYFRADADDYGILTGRDDLARVALIDARIKDWQARRRI